MPASPHSRCAHPSFATMSISISRASSPAEVASCHALRRLVFVHELSVAPSVEFDAHDMSPSLNVAHYLLVSAGVPVATCRLRTLHPSVLKLERFCVAPSARRAGVGRLLAEYVADAAGDDALLFCHAKGGSAPFYQSLGWSVDGGGFEEAGIPHVAMVRRGTRLRKSLGHVCLRTHDIERARMFYSVLGFTDVQRFLVGNCRAAWIQSPYLDLQIELIEVAPFPKSLMRRSADDDMCSRDVGTYHISVDASCAALSLRSLLFSWNDASKARFSKLLTVVTPPQMLSIGGGSIEAAMIQDADGNIVEVMRRAWEVDAVEGRGKEKLFEWEDDGVFREDATV